MEVVVNNTALLCDFITRGILTNFCEFDYVISSEVIERSPVINKLIMRPFIESGKFRIEAIGNLTYSDFHYYTSNYGVKRYAYYEFHSIEIAKKNNLRLVTDNSAMKQLAQAEDVKILTLNQVEDILIRKVKYEDVIKIKKPDNL